MNENSMIPDWLTADEGYEPIKDKDKYIQKSILQMLSVIRKARNDGRADSKISAPIKLLCTIGYVLLISLSKNMFFTYVMMAFILLRIALLSVNKVGKVIIPALGAMLFSMILLLPAVFLGNSKSFTVISIKVFCSVALVNLMVISTNWNKLTEALRLYHIPDVFIFTLDITLKYIVMLGEISYQMLTALKLRSVGKNRDKRNSISGIVGTTFLKSQEISKEMYDAMRCRGFEGEYNYGRKKAFVKYDILAVLGLVIAVFLFVYIG